MGMLKDSIWNIMNKISCCFRRKKNNLFFCNNTHNYTAICKKSNCPLVNKNYAVVLPFKGVPYIFINESNSSIFNLKKWKKYRLNFFFFYAIKEIDDFLNEWPREFKYFNKIRLLKYFQLCVKSKKVKNMLDYNPQVFLDNRKRRILYNTQKTLRSSLALNKSVLKELIYRLKNGVYYSFYLNKRSKSYLNKKMIKCVYFLNKHLIYS